MTRAFALAAVLAAILATAPASAESVCIHKDNCHALPGPNVVGGGMTDNFTVQIRLFGATVVGATGFDLHNFSGNDGRGRLCTNGACSGMYGYTFISDENKCGENRCLLVYSDGVCRQFSRHEPFGSPCHEHD